MAYTNVVWKDKETGEEKTILVQLVKVNPVNLVDTKRINWRDKDGKEITTKRVITLPDGTRYTIDQKVDHVSTNGDKDADGNWVVVPGAEQIPYAVDENGNETQTTEFDMNLKKEGFCDFTTFIPIEEADNYLYTDVYEVTASEKDMYELYQFAKYLHGSHQAAVSNEVVAQKGFSVTGGLMVAVVDEKTKTFTVQMRRVTQKFNTAIKNPIPSGPYVAPPPKRAKKDTPKTKKLF